MLGHQKSLTSVWQSLNLPSIHHPDTSSSSFHRSISTNLPTNANNVVVTTKYGKYIGIKQNILGSQVSAFLGIPYALPPIGNQRFRKSIPIVPSKKMVNATKFSSKCVQLSKEVPIFTDVSSGMSEDCLRLNVWTPVPLTFDDPIRSQVPRSLNLTGSPLKPVMVWIYGGGFFMGTSAFDETDGRVLASYGDVIVVTFDYRVGPLGFIDLESDREPGNQGLYDQMTALKWVKDNIKHFGGDADSITLFGESSGAISISLHMMSPISSKYFTRAILQSGSAFMTDAFYRRSESSVPEFVKSLGCVKSTNRAKVKSTTPASASKVTTTSKKSSKKDDTSDYDYDYGEGEGSSSERSDAVVKEKSSATRPKRQSGDDGEGDEGEDAEDASSSNDKVTFDEEAEESSTGENVEYDIECLRGKSVEEIIRVTKRLHEKYFFAFPPSPEEEFIPLIPSAVAKLDADEKKDIFINMKDVLLGTNENGFSYMLYLANKNIFTRYNVTKDINNIASVRSVMENDLHHLLQMPRFQVDFLVNRQFSQISNSSDSKVYLNKLISLLGDMSFVCPVNELAYELASIGKNVYMYQYNHRSPDSPWGSWFGSTLHDEIPLVFGQPLRYPLKYSGKDIDISKRLMKTWSHFARTGQALPQLGIEWPKYTTTNQTYMKINSEYSQIDYKLSEKSCQSFKLGLDLLS